MTHRQTAWLGGGFLALAIGLAVFKPEGRELGKPAVAGDATAAKSQQRGAMGGTVSQRLERFRLLWRGVSGGKGSQEDSKLAAELIASLPASTLRELLVELAPIAHAEGDPSWLPLMAHRVGELEGQRAADWLIGLRDSMPEDEAAPFKDLLPETVRGWAAGDPLGLMANYFNAEKAKRYDINERMSVDEGASGMGAVIIASAASRSPEETWRSLRTWQRGMLAVAFFDGVDPGQARHYAGRLTELFADLETPGREHLGGEQEDWEEQQKALSAAAGALFLIHPEEALAWREKQDLASSGEHGEQERGRMAGQIGIRLYREQPERALSWISGQSEEFRRAAAGELGYAIVSRPLGVEDCDRLAMLKDWTGGEEERVAWLKGLERSFSRETERRRIACDLLDKVELSEVERGYLTERYAYW